MPEAVRPIAAVLDGRGFGFRPSIHAAVKAAGATLPVSLTALYNKIDGTEPALVRAMVREGAQRLGGVLAALTPPPRAGGSGYAVRIVDGNHLPATEKRLKALRGRASRGGGARVVAGRPQRRSMDVRSTFAG